MTLYQRTVYLPAILLITLLTAACGGGSGGGKKSTEPDPVTDATSRYTIGGSVSGLVNDGLTLQNNGADTLPVGGGIFEFATTVTNGSTYEVTVSSHPENQLCSVENGTGRVYGSAVNDIQVVCRYWRAAERLDMDDSAVAEYPEIASDAEGRAIAVWHQLDGDGTDFRYTIWAAAYIPGSGWNTPVRIDHARTGDAYVPKIIIDTDGSAIAHWRQADGEKSSYWLNTYHPDTGWGTAELVYVYGGTSGKSNPKFSFVAPNTAIAIWNDNYSILSAFYSEISGWGEATTVGSAGDYPASPTMVIAHDDTLAAVWTHRDGTNYSFRANLYINGSWGDATEIGPTSINGYVRIANDGDGNVMALWTQYDGTYWHVWTRKYTSGNNWGGAELLETNESELTWGTSLKFDSKGNAIAVWVRRGTVGAIIAKHYTPAIGWGEAAELTAGEGIHYFFSNFVFTPDDHAIMIWNEFDGDKGSLYATTYTATDGWGIAQPIELNSTGMPPRIVADGNHNAIAIWTQWNGDSRSQIWANRFE